MFATLPARLLFYLLGAASAIRFARHHLPDWMFYPACALVALVVVCSLSSAISAWKQKRAVAVQCSERAR